MEENITDKNPSPAQPQDMRSPRGEVYDWMQCIVTALVFCVLLFVFVVRLVDVNGPSMQPTLWNSDKMVVSNILYTPKQGDIIIFKKTQFKDEALVKRVIATAGQTVNIDFSRGVVYVNGEALDEPYTAEPTNNQIDFNGEVTVPEGCIFVMGDNRNDSTDSRDNRIGMVDTRLVIGKVYITLFPFAHFGSVYK